MKPRSRVPILLLAGGMALAGCGTGSGAQIQTKSSAGGTTTTAGSPNSTRVTSVATSTTTATSTTAQEAPSTTQVPPSTVPGLPPEQPTGAVEITPTTADLNAIGTAYATFIGFTGCPVEPVPAQLHAAEITATGVKWAFGPMQTQPGCTVIQDGKPTNPMTLGPISNPPENAAVLTQKPDGTWTVNWFESYPFPCPADLLHPRLSPGPGSAAVPLAVLNAVGVTWSNSPKCNTALEYLPPPAGGE